MLSHPKNPWTLVEEAVDIGITNGLISEIGSLPKSQGKTVLSLNNIHILPGLMDTQVHFREPGMEHKEDIAHGSLAAIKGGITTFFEMPNTTPPTMTQEALENKVQRAQKTSWCDFAFYVGAGKGNVSELPKLRQLPGCCGVKVFMGKSTGDLLVKEQELLEQIVSQSGPGVTAIHSEDEDRLNERKPLASKQPPSVHNHPIWRDAKTALLSTQKVARIAEKYKKPIHILHLSTKEEMEFLENHRELVSTEVTPQHLTLSAPECYEAWGTLVQMNPPIRDKTHQEALWRALQRGVVDIIGSDHAPHTLEEKQKPYPGSPSGMPGVQTLLPLMLDHVHHRRLDLKTLVKLLSLNPARRFKIKNQGLIKKGYKAHFTLVDLKAKKTITSSWLASKCGWSPFEGRKVTGWPVGTILYGKPVVREGEVLGKPTGQPVEFDRSLFCL